MTSTTLSSGFSGVLVCAACAAIAADGGDSLSIEVDVPQVPLTLRSPGREAIRLPALEFRFAIRARCTAERIPGSLSLSVADTRKSVAAAAIVTGGATEVTLKIPAAQIAPLVIGDFCIEQGDVSGDRLTIPSALSAQASLLCQDAEDQLMTYASQPLDVALVCDRDSGSEPAGERRRIETP